MMQQKRENTGLSQEMNKEHPELFTARAKDTLRIVSRVDGRYCLGFFDNESLSLLSHISSLDTTVHPEMAARLVQCVVFGEEAEAKKLVSACPNLLYYKAKVKDYSGRTIIGTALQAALGAEDIRMCQMLLPYFEHLKEGEALNQFNEQFPHGLEAEDKSNKEQAYDFSPIVDAIIANEPIDEVEVMKQFIPITNEISVFTHQ
jgi:hypothetical protein